LLYQSRESGDGVGFPDQSPGFGHEQPRQNNLANRVDEFGAERLRGEPEETGNGFLGQCAGLRTWRRRRKLQSAVRQRNRLKKLTPWSNIAAPTLRDNGHSGGRKSASILAVLSRIGVPRPCRPCCQRLLVLLRRLRLLLHLLDNKVPFFG